MKLTLQLMTTVVTLALLSSCNTDFRGMLELQQEISRKVPCKEVQLNVKDGSELKVTLVNSPYNDSSADAKAQLSILIGKMASEHKELMHQIKHGSTFFVNESSFAIAKVTQTDSYPMQLGN
jgi:hypothetical protein